MEKNKELTLMMELILNTMKETANFDNGSLQSGVFSAFEISLILNKHNTFAYQIRKNLKELKSLGFVDMKKFFVDNESNLKCWKWVITNKGYNTKYNNQINL